jgi:uncharacterized protein
MGIAIPLITDKRDFQIFIKPAGPACNLDCSYCYYLQKKNLFRSVKVMDENLLERLIRQQIEATTEPVVTFSWHGGEPLMAGVEFYSKAIDLQQKFCPPGKTIKNAIQTNGTLVDETWCRFFADHGFGVGISLDGPESLHNSFRVDKAGTGTFGKVMDAFDLLVMHGVEPEALCVIHSKNVNFPKEVYRFFTDLGISFLTFIPLVERVNGCVTGNSADPESFGRFLCTVFDEWQKNDIGKIKIQIIEETLRVALNIPHSLCIFRPECGGIPVIEHNGNFYMCDHFVTVEHLVGNIKETTVSGMLDCERQQSFGRMKASLPQYCLKCEVLSMCHGECPKNRFITTPDGEPGLNYLCRGYRMFFNHCRPMGEALRGCRL